MQMTTLPRSFASTEMAVWVAPSHGVAMTTTSPSAAPSLSAAPICEAAVGPALEQLVDGLHGPVLRPRADDDVEPDRRQPGRQGRAGGPGAAQDADAHGAGGYRPRLVRQPTEASVCGTPVAQGSSSS